MASPSFAVLFYAPLSGTVGAGSAGDVLIPDATSGLYVKATTANRGTRRSTGIALSTYGVSGTVEIQQAGQVDAVTAGLGAGSAAWVRVSTTGQLERVTPSGSDDIVGYVEADGTFHACFGFLTAAIVNGGGSGGVTPTGTGFTHVTAGVQDAAAVAVNLATAHVTGVLPTANQAAQSIAGDVGGTTAAATISALALSKLAPGTNGHYVQTVGGVMSSAAPSIALASQVTGILPAANGGLGASAAAFTGLAKWAAGVASAATLVDADVAAGAAVAVAKLAPSATNGHVLTTTAGAVVWAASAGGGAPAGASGDWQKNSAGAFGSFTPGAGVETFVVTPTSANLLAAVTDETGTGSLVFGTAPLFKTTINLNNPANTFKYVVTSAAIAADRIVSLPLLTATDTLVCEAFAASLTNKTIVAASNTITDTAAALGDILRFDGTRFVRLARGTANQVLTTNAGATDIAWAAAAGGGGVPTGTGFYRVTGGAMDAAAVAETGTVNVVRSTSPTVTTPVLITPRVQTRLDIDNTAGTFQYQITPAALAANRILNLPLLTATDTLVAAAFTQTLTNKTLTSPVINTPNFGANALSTTSTVTALGFVQSGTATNATAGGTINNCTLGSNYRIRFTNATGPTVTGFDATGVADGTVLTVYAGAATVAITHEDALSTAANRITLNAGITINIPQGCCTQFIYLTDGTNSRWRHMAATAI